MSSPSVVTPVMGEGRARSIEPNAPNRKSRSRSSSSSSSTSNETTNASAISTRTLQAFQTLRDVWSKRVNQSVISNTDAHDQFVRAMNEILIVVLALARNPRVTPILHQNWTSVMEMGEVSVDEWRKNGNEPRQAQSIPAASTTNTSATCLMSGSPSSSTISIPPYTIHLILRLILLFTQRLPLYYDKLFTQHTKAMEEWQEQQKATSTPHPAHRLKSEPILPAGVNWEAYANFFKRGYDVSDKIVQLSLEDVDRRKESWTPRLCLTAFHIQVLAGFYSRPLVLDDPTHTFMNRLEKVMLINDWFNMQLIQYDQLKQLFEFLAELLHLEGDRRRMGTVTLLVLQAWRLEPPPTSTPSFTPDQLKAHHPDLLITSTPPGLILHQSLMTWMALMTAHLWQQEFKRRQPDESSSDSLGQLWYRILSELQYQFVHTTHKQPSNSNPNYHRSLISFYALVGFINGFAPPINVSELAAPSTEEDAFIKTYLPRSVQLLTEMFQFQAFNLSDIASFDRVDSSAEVKSSGCTWPCQNSLGVSCSSCLFLWLFSAAIIYSSRWLNEVLELLKSPSDSQQLSPASRLIERLTRVTTKAFLQLLDVTWALNGSIQLRPPQPLPQTPPPTPSESSLPTSSQTSRDHSNNASANSIPRPNRLFLWLRSPFYELLPSYTRTLAQLFLLQNSSSSAQLQVMGEIWSRMKYMHLVWRWYDQYGGGNTHAPMNDSDKRTLKQAMKRLMTNTKMEPTNNPIEFPSSEPTSTTDATASPTYPSSPVLLQPIRLNRTTLKRAQNSLFMSLVLFMSTVVQDSNWRNKILPPWIGESQTPSIQDREAYSDTHLRQAMIVAMILDTLANLEWIAATAGGFKPYTTLIEIVLALVTSREILQDQPDGIPSSSTLAASSSPGVSSKDDRTHERDVESFQQRRSHQSAIYRQQFTQSVLVTYLKCLFHPKYDEKSNPNEFTLTPTLGLETEQIHLERIITQSNGLALPALFAASNLPFAPTILKHPSLEIPNPLLSTWPQPCAKLAQLTASSSVLDLPQASRDYFLAGLFAGCITHIPWPISLHYILPWSWPQIHSTNQPLNKRMAQLLVSIIQRGYQISTSKLIPPTANDEVPIIPNITQLHSSIPSAPSGPELESYLRLLIPYFVSQRLDGYPKSVSFESLMNTCLVIFLTLPNNDLLLLVILKKLMDKSSRLLMELCENQERMARWRQVVELVEVEGGYGSMTNEQIDDERKLVVSADEESQSKFGQTIRSLLSKLSSTISSEPPTTAEPVVHDLPPNVRLPNKFPSLSPARSLILLYLQLMQSLDAPLYPRALNYLEDLFQQLDPKRYPIATPIRASLGMLIHGSLVRGFDLSKRDATAEWYIHLSQSLQIPVGLREENNATNSSPPLNIDHFTQ